MNSTLTVPSNRINQHHFEEAPSAICIVSIIII